MKVAVATLVIWLASGVNSLVLPPHARVGVVVNSDYIVSEHITQLGRRNNAVKAASHSESSAHGTAQHPAIHDKHESTPHKIAPASHKAVTTPPHAHGQAAAHHDTPAKDQTHHPAHPDIAHKAKPETKTEKSAHCKRGLSPPSSPECDRVNPLRHPDKPELHPPPGDLGQKTIKHSAHVPGVFYSGVTPEAVKDHRPAGTHTVDERMDEAIHNKKLQNKHAHTVEQLKDMKDPSRLDGLTKTGKDGKVEPLYANKQEKWDKAAPHWKELSQHFAEDHVKSQQNKEHKTATIIAPKEGVRPDSQFNQEEKPVLQAAGVEIKHVEGEPSGFLKGKMAEAKAQGKPIKFVDPTSKT